jgi:hypothetical protein
MSLNETLWGYKVFISHNNFVGEFHSISSCTNSDSYIITYINNAQNSHCRELITSSHMCLLGYKGLVDHILRNGTLFDTSMYRLISG